jgi:hypothetical protein
MTFVDWNEFIVLMFCPENEVMIALIQEVLPRQAQCRGVCKDLIDMSGYMDTIAIVLKFHGGLNVMTQDRITKSGTDRLQDSDLNGRFKAAHQLDLNHLANETFHYASRHPKALSMTF